MWKTRGCRVTRTTSDTRYWKWAPRSSTGSYFEVGDHIKEKPISHVSDVLRHYQAHLLEQSSLSSPLSVSGLQGLFFFFFSVTFITWLISCISEIVWANALIRRVSEWICPGTIKCPLFTFLKMRLLAGELMKTLGEQISHLFKQHGSKWVCVWKSSVVWLFTNSLFSLLLLPFPT